MLRWLKSISGLLAPLLAVIGVVAFFALVDVLLHGSEATFWSKQNLQSISVQNAFVAICALGMLLVIVSGGIDLSAGATLALCATIFAWGLREDVGGIVSQGENVAGAATRLKAADEWRRDAASAGDAGEVERATAEVERRRAQLVQLLQVKRTQLERTASLVDESNRIEHDRKIAEIAKAIEDVQVADSRIASNPPWLRSVPNAASTASLAIAMCLLTGVLCGLLNGVLIVALRVVPFIATLGTMTFFLGLAMIVADETAVRPSSAQIPSWLGELAAVRPDPAWLFVSKGVWLALVLAALMAIVLKYSVFGRHVFALGSNEATARLCGVNVPLVKICVYTLSGLLVGIAAVCFFSRLNSGNPTAGTGLELKFIAAVVIGGASLSGGRGTVLGTLAGTAIMGVIASGGTLLGLSNPTQYIALGVIVIAAVAVDQLRKSRNF
jgi:ribose/xylose/arabinose/galactoside ABC-type transport system permease subunit